MSDTKKKTPSARVIAAYLIRETLTNVPNNVTPEELKSLVDSRVNEAKKDKTIEQFNKITLKTKERVQKIIDKFEGKTPAPARKNGKAPPPKKKAPGTKSVGELPTPGAASAADVEPEPGPG